MSAETVPIFALVISSLIIVALCVILRKNLKEAPFCRDQLRASWQMQVRSIGESSFGQAWRQSFGQMFGPFFANCDLLRSRFEQTPPVRQEALVLRMSQAVTIGSACLVFNFVYSFLPTCTRVILLPAVLVAAWMIGSKIARK